MNKTYILLILTTLLFTSCFEIIEEVDLNEDGSGKFELTLNLSQSKSKVKSVMLMDTVNGYKVPNITDIDNYLNTISNKAASINGLTSINTQANHTDYIYSFTCSFSNIEQLNDLITHISTKNNLPTNKNLRVKHFEYNSEQKTVIRNGNYSIKEYYNKLKQTDRNIFENAQYICIYRFKNLITNVSNKRSNLAPTKKAVMLKTTANQLINETHNINNKIELN